jgi:hypothetical protein
MVLNLSAVALRLITERMLYRRWPSVTYLLAFSVATFYLIRAGIFLLQSGFCLLPSAILQVGNYC